MRRFICYNSIIAEREAGTPPEGWTPPVGGARLRPFSVWHDRCANHEAYFFDFFRPGA